MAGTNSLLQRIFGLTDTHNRRPQRSDFIGLNQESEQMRNLVAVFPLWEGGGTIFDVGPYGFIGRPTNTLWAYDPYFGIVSQWDGGLPSGANNTPTLARNYKVTGNTGYVSGFPDPLDFGRISGGLNPAKLTSKSFSIAAWVKVTIPPGQVDKANNPPNMYIVTFDCLDGASFPGYGFGCSMPNAQDRIIAEWDVDGSGSQASIFGRVPINDGNWHHIVAVYESPDVGGGTMATYVDGQFDMDQSGGSPSGTLVTPVPFLLSAGDNAPQGIFFIGSDDDGKGSQFNGLLCDLRLYNRAITLPEVLAMFAPDTRWQLYNPRRSYTAFPKPPPPPITAADSPLTTDSVDRVASAARTTDDSPATTDSVVRAITFVRTTSDVPQTTDSVSAVRTLIRVPVDFPSTSETLAVASTLVRAIADSPATTDSVNAVKAQLRSATDAPATTDAATRVLTVTRSLTSAPATTDSIVRIASLVRTASDAPATTDVASQLVFVTRAFADASATTDSIAIVSTLVRAASDSPQTTDATVRVAALVRTTSDSPQTTDSIVLVSTLARTVSDSPLMTDSAARVGTFFRSISDAPATTESVVRSFVIIRTTTDSPATAESIASTSAKIRTVSDSPTTTDAAPRVLTLVRVLVDSVSTVDVPVRNALLVRSATETPTTTDSVVRVQSNSRTAHDTPSSTDALARILAMARSISSAPTTTDAAVATIIQPVAFEAGGTPFGSVDPGRGFTLRDQGQRFEGFDPGRSWKGGPSP
jgi:hypothetical protein